ncbi:MAG TPA: hypothetical protein VHZ09_02320 [Acidobacteriaceae bacterium]|jgi:hypothetical protein|nr:hypothetical protein [Acidobacteriaceae bacterium]
MLRRSPKLWAKVGLFLFPLGLSVPAFAVSCTTQSQMTAAQRTPLEETARMLGANVQSGNASAVQAQTISAVASQFNGIAGSIQAINADIHGAAMTVDEIYLLDATDMKAAGDAQFFCGVSGSPLTVVVTIPGLPPGKYALAILHATGVKQPQQISMILQNDPTGSQSWKLAGFFTKPMTLVGHDGIWYWRQARDYAAKHDAWAAYFYYQTALSLLQPVDFISSPNLQKLQHETDQTRPGDLPGVAPMKLTAGNQTFNITNVHTGELSNQLDLVVTYDAAPNQTLVQSREQVTAVMRALLQQHPALAQAFHGLWVYAAVPGSNLTPFALELPIDQIQNSSTEPHT